MATGEDDQNRFCEVCQMWISQGDLHDHIIGKKHRLKLRSALTSDDSEPEEELATAPPEPQIGGFHTLVMGDPSQDTTLVFSVYDLGGTEVGSVQLTPSVTWSELAAAWFGATMTRLLPPDGTQRTTAAGHLPVGSLTAVNLEPHSEDSEQ